MTDPAEPTGVRSLLRGLHLVEALTTLGFATAAQLAEATRLPRPTVYRLVDTMMQAGYVARIPDSDLYVVAQRLRTLARSVRADVEATIAAGPLVAALSSELMWPVDFFTCEDGEMIVRISTHPKSPTSLMPRNPLGFRLPMMSGPGLAFLAHLPPAEVASLLDREDSDKPDVAELEQKLGQVRRRGYAERKVGPPPSTSSFSVPVLVKGRPAGCITVMFIRSVGPIEKMAERYLKRVSEVAGEIERATVQAISL